MAMRTLASLWLAAAETLPQQLADEFGAKCLDGTSPKYEMTRNESSTKWVLFLEGGGWCFGPTEEDTKRSCAARAGFIYPPNASWKLPAFSGKSSLVSDADIGGIMSQDPALNPDFYSWNKVFLRYCDGASFAGNRDEPIAVSTQDGQPAQIWLRGRRNFDALVHYFQSELGMDAATEVILSGGSAGGLAVFYNLDHLATLLPQNVRLTGFPDGGFFLDAASVAGTFDYRQNFLGADPVWNITASSSTNRRCLGEHGGEEWKCLMAPYLASHIETPLYVMNSAYDVYQMENILKAECVPDPSKAPCNEQQNRTLQAYYDKLVADVAAVSSKPQNGLYIDSCYVHEQNVDFCSSQSQPNCVGWTPKEPGSMKWGYTTAVNSSGRSFTPQQAFSAYYHGDKRAFVVIDQSRYPDNPSCQFLGHPVTDSQTELLV